MELQKTDCVTTVAAKAGFRHTHRLQSSRTVNHSPCESTTQKQTRSGPLADIFDSQVVLLLEEHVEIRPKAVQEHLLKQASRYEKKYRPTLERRIRDQQAKYGPDQEIVFPQNLRPSGNFASSDFTHVDEDTITVSGRPLKHRLYHFRLPWSGYSYVQEVLSGESFAALMEGLQGALNELERTPPGSIKTDYLSAAFRNVSTGHCKDQTGRYTTLSEAH